MLILSRKTNESIIVNDDIEITVCRVEKNRVRVGIRAPHHIRICRSELLVTEELDEVPGKVLEVGSSVR